MILLTCRILKNGTNELISKAEIELRMEKTGLWGKKGGQGENERFGLTYALYIK